MSVSGAALPVWLREVVGETIFSQIEEFIAFRGLRQFYTAWRYNARKYRLARGDERPFGPLQNPRRQVRGISIDPAFDIITDLHGKMTIPKAGLF